LLYGDERLYPGDLVIRADHVGHPLVGMVLSRDEWGFYQVFWFHTGTSWGGYEGIGSDLIKV
jgi:hypothetical protein